MIALNKEAKHINFFQFGIKSEEISELLTSINKTIKNIKQENPNIDMSKYPNVEIYNTWKIYNPKWNNMDFPFQVEVMEYINLLKDEKGIFLL